ncbi:hypothetical protein A0J57_06890 [Sphingobium sp. 22B]|uniref:hypothetical protein n=1 Tax=unclassified Sphingobium TaxID=2611147 RepID=UPI00078136F1|nr:MULTISPECIES: hypothetical protein [unclassified Sphingobium]KXU32929.1 hypothetical protein AXW74_04920 [Sphingobium sp. AM]KYC33109.1 hypothetical protein A0J57_06890 [Sphingobium sp. 22B]OAP33234.1 hypothetical protein A8O16_05050 [Sphingobium sp. 20006FA]
MKFIVIAPFLALMSTLAEAQTPPNSQTVTSIAEAAQICGFDKAGLKWIEKAPDTIAIKLSMADMQGATPKMALLKNCFFGWAYDRNVKVEVGLEE